MDQLPGLLAALSYHDDRKFLQLVEKELEKYLSRAEVEPKACSEDRAVKIMAPLVFPSMTGHHRYLIHQV
jgi:hypothetical protein